jgi:hypothetical protein
MSTFVQENLTGVRIVRAYGRRPSRPAFRRVQRGLPRAQHEARGVDRGVPAAPHADLRRLDGAGDVARRARGHRGAHHGRRLRRVHLLPDAARLADDRARMGGEPLPARRGVDGPHQPDPPDEPTVAAPPRTDPHRGPAGRVEFRDVSFAYPGTESGCCRASTSPRPGATVAVVGPTGGGQEHAGRAPATAVRPDGGPRSCSTACRSPSSIRRSCAPSAWCPRTPSSSRTPSRQHRSRPRRSDDEAG